jgi:aldehyde dehydrogenase (NAD+)
MTITEILETMDYGTAPESASDALRWLKQNAPFGQFINGKMTGAGDTFAVTNPATGDLLAQVSQATQADVDAAVVSARGALGKWSKMGGQGRARVLYALARLLQKHSRLFAVLETLDNGKPIRESRDVDIPLAQRHFYYHAGMAALMDTELPDRAPIGVCGQIIPWNFPLLMLAWKIAPALAMGNTVVLKPAEYTPLTALLFAHICAEAGVPKGVINIVTGDGRVGEMIVAHDGIDKIAFTGSTEVGRKIRAATAGSGKALTLELGGKSPFIVFDDADLDSAVEGVVDAIWFNQGQVCCAGSRLLVQEGVADQFYAKLRDRMAKLRVGNPLDKSVDMGAIVDTTQLARIHGMVDACDAGEKHAFSGILPDQGLFYPPTLITGLSTADTLMQDEIFGPVLVSMTFRTPSEAIALANNTRYGLAASIWSENINLALGVAPKIKAGVIWINGTNMFDAAAGFGGMRESGFGREGGWDGLYAYTKAKNPAKKIKPVVAKTVSNKDVLDIDRTAKLYIGGKQARPDGGYSKPIHDARGRLVGHMPIASRKDIRNAVEAAQAASSWSGTTGHLRAQILYYMAENLSARGAEFARNLDAYSGAKNGKDQVEKALDTLFTFAAWADKNDGGVCNTPMRGATLSINEPIGVIGAFCGETAPLVDLITPIAAGLSMGNRMVIVAPENAPLIATDLYQILDTSDVPAGVVNILTGDHADLAPTMASHMDIDAVWSLSHADISKTIEEGSVSNLKRTWVNNGRESGATPHEFLRHATETKVVWIPYGEG